jgi:uncharacterized protein (DUF2235 family)
MTDKPEPKHEKRPIVTCCDGTGNEISENISKVLKLYRCLRKTEKTTPRQSVFYDPGVGTLARPGLAFVLGLRHRRLFAPTREATGHN